MSSAAAKKPSKTDPAWAKSARPSARGAFAIQKNEVKSSPLKHAALRKVLQEGSRGTPTEADGAKLYELLQDAKKSINLEEFNLII